MCLFQTVQNQRHLGEAVKPVDSTVLLLLLILTVVNETFVYIHCMLRLIGTVLVPSHLGVKLLATLAPPAFDDQQLLIIEGRKNSLKQTEKNPK